MVNDLRADAPLLVISEEVGMWADHGLMSMALDPDFNSNDYIYLYYVVDWHHLLHFGTSSYDSETNEYENATIGRVTRYQVDLNDLTQLASEERHIIIGQTKETGIPICTTSHGVGTVMFGSDKTMLLTVGDGNEPGSLFNGVGTPAGYDVQAMEDGILKPEENIGAFRSQFLNSYCGKLLRVDKETGLGIPSNPFYEDARANEPISKVWSLGLRNPFRMSLVPSTGSSLPTAGNPGDIMIGDVGDWTWEEVNIADGPRLNFGWPIYQGPIRYLLFEFNYASDSTRPLSPGCDQPYLFFQDVIVDPKPNHDEVWEDPCGGLLSTDDYELFVHERPIFTYSNLVVMPTSEAVIPGFDTQGNSNYTSIVDMGIAGAQNFSGAATVGGLVYHGGAYPEAYYNTYFHADYARWLKVMTFDDLGNLEKIEHWDNDIGYVAHLSLNPINESVYCATLFPGEIKKITFNGNLRPIAILDPDTVYALGPLTLNFDASQSYDPEGTALNYSWDFGDGTQDTGESVTHTFSSTGSEPQSFEVQLTVVDQDGYSSNATGLVSLNNTPPEVEIISFDSSLEYSIEDITVLPLEASISDLESEVEDLEIEWRVYLHHNNHFHLEQSFNTEMANASILPVGCGVETYWYRIELSVTDPQGLQTVVEVEIKPACNSETVFPDSFVIYPNPAWFNVVVQLNEKTEGLVELELYDETGKHVKSEQYQVEENQTKLIFSVNGIANGGYVLHCKSAHWEKKRRLVINRQ